MQKVKLGPSDGQRIAVTTGLEPGESVVIDGADRLRDGAKVTVAPARNLPRPPPSTTAAARSAAEARRRAAP